MLTVAVCDDDGIEIERTHDQLKMYMCSHPDTDISVSLFNSGDMLLSAVDGNHVFDIYILDIIMPVMSGIDLGCRLRERGITGQIIYLSSSRDYAIESYDADALHYLVKPVTAAQFSHAIDKAVRRICQKQQKAFMVNTRNGVVRVMLDQVLWVEQSSRMMHFHLSDGGIVTSCALREPFSSAVKPLLGDPRFLLCGSSFVVNLHRISRLDRVSTVFSDGCSIILPHSLQKELKREWTDYWLKRHDSCENNEISSERRDVT